MIAGGKLTTYRVMAEDAVDFALGEGAKSRPSITSKVPLLGAVGLAVQQNWGRRHAATYGWTPALVDHLLHRYGGLLTDIVALCEEDPSMARPLEHAPAYLRAEIAYAVSHEGVLHLEDILLHRTRLNYEILDRGLAALEEISQIAAAGLGWDEETRLAEVAAYTARAEAEAAAQDQPDDASAEHVRLAAQDVSPLIDLTTSS